MTALRASSLAASLVLHAALLGWMLHVPVVGQESLEAGAGADMLTVENAISIEGPLMVGDAAETLKAQEIPPTEVAEVPPPVEEVKVDELADVIKTTSLEQTEAVAVEEPKPERPEPPPAAVAAQVAPPEQMAVDTHQSSGRAKAGGDPTLQRQYLGSLSKTLEKHKIFPKSRDSGTVVVRFTVAPTGELLSREVAASSGSPLLDEAAVRSLERAAPFPPMPSGASIGPLVVSVPFRYIAR